MTSKLDNKIMRLGEIKIMKFMMRVIACIIRTSACIYSMLTRWGLPRQIYFRKIPNPWMRNWTVSCSAPSHYPEQWNNAVTCELDTLEFTQNLLIAIFSTLHLKESSAKCHPLCSGSNVLIVCTDATSTQCQWCMSHGTLLVNIMQDYEFIL